MIDDRWRTPSIFLTATYPELGNVYQERQK